MHLGDYSTGSTVFFMFTTVGSSGAPTALSSGGVTVYRNSSTVANATGLTLTADFGGVTAQNHVAVGMISTSAFYEPGNTYMAVVSSGSVGGQSIAGYEVGRWTVGLKPVVTVSTAVSISTASAIDSVTNVNSTVEANVVQWRGTTPSTLDTNDHIRVSTAQTLGAVAAIGSTVQADVALWRGTAPSTLGVNANITPSTAAVIASVASLIDISTTAALVINAEVVDVLETDTHEPPGAGVPSSAASIKDMVAEVYSDTLYQVTVSSSAKNFYTKAGAVRWGKALTQDSTGSTGVYTEAGASTST